MNCERKTNCVSAILKLNFDTLLSQFVCEVFLSYLIFVINIFSPHPFLVYFSNHKCFKTALLTFIDTLLNALHYYRSCDLGHQIDYSFFLYLYQLIASHNTFICHVTTFMYKFCRNLGNGLAEIRSSCMWNVKSIQVCLSERVQG